MQGTDGAIGYVDYSDAKASGLDVRGDQEPSREVRHADPRVGCRGRAQGATVNPDLTYDPINATGADAYPITSPTWILVYKNQTDADEGQRPEGLPQLHLRHGPGAGAVGRLRPAAEGLAEAGQGAGQEDRRPGERASGGVAHGTGAPRPSRAPARPSPTRVDSGSPRWLSPPRPDRRAPGPAAAGLSAGRGRPGIVTDRVFRCVALVGGLLVLVILALIVVLDDEKAWPWFEPRASAIFADDWDPGGRQFGAGLIYGTFLVGSSRCSSRYR